MATAATEPEDYYDLSLERQREDNDMRNQVVISAVWKPNYFEGFNPVVRNVLDGWSITATISMHSGKPFAITSGNDDNLDGNNNDRPNVLSGKAERVLDTHRSRRLTVPSGLTPPRIAGLLRPIVRQAVVPSGRDGLVRVNSLDGPGYTDVDASLFRDFNIYERVKFRFRGEATNVFNFVNLGNPGGALSSTSSFGVISSAANTSAFGSMRVLQVGGRLLF